MVKKILCVVTAIVLTILEHLCFGVNPKDVLATLVLAVGFTYTCDVFYMDFIEDHKCTPLMWAVYGCMLVTTALLGAALLANQLWPAIVAAFVAVGGVTCYLIEKHGLKKAAEAK